LSRPVTPQARLFSSPWRLVIDFPGSELAPALAVPEVDFAVVQGVRVGQFQPGCARVVIDLTRPVEGRILADPTGQVLVELNAPAARATLQAGELRRPSGASGRVVVGIDPGHGGRDVGASGVGGLQEAAITLDVARRLRSLLEAQALTVRMTREGDVRLPHARRIRFVLDRRLDLFLSLHCDASDGDCRGTTVYHHGGAAASTELAEQIRAAVAAGTGLPDRGVRSDTTVYRSGFYVLRYCRAPAVLCEMAYVTHPADAAQLASPFFRQRLAECLANGIFGFLLAGSRGDEPPVLNSPANPGNWPVVETPTVPPGPRRWKGQVNPPAR
jgi:N-acetylmuramoyl-L-alanine amidase